MSKVSVRFGVLLLGVRASFLHLHQLLHLGPCFVAVVAGRRRQKFDEGIEATVGDVSASCIRTRRVSLTERSKEYDEDEVP